ncbi:hypothetical protein SCANM63S_09478 [Streptomyces canarius]
MYAAVDSIEPGDQVGNPCTEIMSRAAELAGPNTDWPSTPETSFACVTSTPGSSRRSTAASRWCQAATSAADGAGSGDTLPISSPRSMASRAVVPRSSRPTAAANSSCRVSMSASRNRLRPRRQAGSRSWPFIQIVNSETTQASPALAAHSTVCRSLASASGSKRPGSGSKSRQNTKNRTAEKPASAISLKSRSIAAGSQSVQMRQPAPDGW